MNYIELFQDSVKKFGSKPAVVDQDGQRSTSYLELDHLSSLIAGKLHSLGLKKGDAVVIYMGRRLEYTASYLGIMKAGCIVSPSLHDYPKERIDFIVKNCDAKLVITESFFDDINDYPEFQDLASDKEGCVLVYTSGSTGNPKGILHSCGDLYRATERIFETFSGLNPIRVGSAAPFAFVAQIYETFGTLACGGTLFIISDEQRKSATALADFVKKHEITSTFATAQMLKVFKNTSSSLQKICSGGERVSDVYSDDYKIEVHYGMSEEFLASRFIIDKKYDNTPIGRGSSNTELRIVDDNGNEVPDGIEGEICCVGEFDTCYYNNPEKTAEVFVKLPDGRTMIHSGDVGYRNENGDVVYVNRMDWMVKINGQRVETLEIEILLKNSGLLSDAVVHFFVDRDGQNYLVAYYVPKDNDQDNLVMKLRELIESKLPKYMMPRYFVKLDSLPRNFNGKLDRKSLKEPKTSDFRVEYVAPTTELEEQICKAFDSVLGCGQVGLKDDFFMLGGDSIKTIRLLDAVNAEGLTREMILLGKTPAGIAKAYEKRTNAIAHDDEIKGEYPLTAAQRGVYLECIAQPESVMYNIPLYSELPKNIDLAKYEDAIKKVASVHKSFNTTFKIIDGEAKMLYKPSDIVVTHKAVDSVFDEVKKFVRPFDLENGPLYRFELWEDKDGAYFAFDVHHLIFDGTSIELLLNQIDKAYAGEKIPTEALTLFDIATHEINIKETDEYKAADEFFKGKLSDVDADSVIIADVITENYETGSGKLAISSEDIFSNSVIEAFARQNGITENTLFMAAFAYTLAKFNGAKDALFCTVNNGRHDSRLENTIGMFVRTLPLYFEIDEKQPVGEFLAYTQDYFFNTMNHDCIDMSELVHDYSLNTTIQFVYQAEMLDKAKEIPLGELAGDIQIMVHKINSGYKAVVNYAKDKYSEGLMKSFANMFFAVVEGFMNSNKLSDIDLAGSDAKGLIEKFNKTEVPYDTKHTVVELFRNQAQNNPDAECVVCGDRRYTYKEVDELSDKLAKHLVKCGIKTETVTGILIPRDEYMTIASLGVLKAGGAYMPLDPSYPPERLNLMMHDADAMMLITTPDLNSIITEDYDGQRMMTFEIPRLDDCDVDLSQVCPKPKDRFVMLYTSGTTGTPKGVIYEHANVMCLADWMRRFFKYDSKTKRAVYASYGFDANVFDQYGVLTSGGALHVILEDIRLDLVAIQKYFNENKITDCVMTTQVGRQFALMEGTTSLRELSVAGEALTPLQPVGPYTLYNLYGPSEGTVLVSQFVVDKKYKNVPIGKAIENVKLYVIDENKRLLPVGATGELVISGPHVTRGYLNRPDKTAESYSDNPFSKDPGYERLYHTGDIVRYMPDGNIQFVGRRDMQVKIRGFRVELTEVEEVVRRFPGVKDATVVAFDNNAGGKFMAAYVVSDNKIAEKDIKEFVKAEKPPYMVPSVVMQIDNIPLNQNQKVNKRALPVPEFKAEDIIPPQTEMQQKIFDILADAIGHRNFGIDTDIYEAGLTSIGSVRLNYDLAESFGVAVKTSDVSSNSTVRMLEAFLSSAGVSETYELLGDYPITQTQNGIFVECISSPDSTMYNIPVLFKMASGLDLGSLKNAVTKAVDAHPYIKMRLHMNDNGDIRALRNDDTDAVISMFKQDELPNLKDMVKPFKMLDSDLYRISIYETKAGNYLFMDLHHIIADGTSELILLSDIKSVLEGKDIAKESYTAFELGLDEEKNRASKLYDDAKAYYDSLLSGCDSDCLPAKTMDAKEFGSAEYIKSFGLDVDAVEKFCSINKLTPNAFFNAVFAFTLSEFTHKEQTVYTTIHNGRSDSRLANSVAMLVKTIPVLTSIDGEKSPKDFTADVQKQLVKNMNSDIFSFAEVANAYDIKSDLIFVYQGADFGMDALDSEYMTMNEMLPGDAKAPISFEMSITSGKYLVKFDYKTELFNSDFAESFVDSFETAARNFLSASALKEVSILSDEAKKFIDKHNATETEIKNVPAYQLIEDASVKFPDKTAVVANGESVSFKEFNERANRIANSLIELGVKPDDIIGLVVGRSVNVLASQVGIMKAGGAYLPMLPEYPDERLNYCLADSESKLVITTEAIKAEKPELFASTKPYVTKTVEELLNNSNAQNPGLNIPMDAMAYCIYTSGSTGNPKGVMIEHRNMTNFVQSYDGTQWAYRYDKVTGAALGMSSVSFDMSVSEIYPALCFGMTFVMATEEEIHNPAALSELLVANNVQCVTCTPSFITNMIDIPEFSRALANVKSILLAAESLPANVVDRLKQLSPDIRIVNGYGPTETTVGCSAKIVDDINHITIGGASKNVKLVAIDRFGNILPKYASGELIICGAGVTRGYVKLPEKTKACFYNLLGLPAYHSGDIVRLDKNGEFEFFGRSDNQVKLRGFRVELDEIEKTFCSYTGIKQSKVVVRNNGKEDYLAAFFTADHQVDLPTLRTHLKSTLTYYMVPAAIMQLDAMPLTPNGKIDKKALPEISVTKKQRDGKRVAKKSLEEELCTIFKDVLSLDEYYADDDFFEMGGTSLSASKVTMLLMSKGIEIQYQDIFDNPTPEELAELINSKSGNVNQAEEKKDSNASEFDAVLKYNSLPYASEVTRKALGNVFLTGAAGFLGMHILFELINSEKGMIYCLVRKGKYQSPLERLKKMAAYYFDDTYDEIFNERIRIVDADVTSEDLEDILKDIDINTIINCAAIVKHYAADDSLEQVNVHGVENLIKIAKAKDAKLIQISTTSIPGVHTDETYKQNLKMYENNHFVIDSMDNKYITSKYHAECKMFEAIKNGLRGKVIRVGNLMGRHSDGEFQFNMTSNAFLNALRGFAAMGLCPVGHSTDPMGFSPVDLTAKAVVILAGTDDKFTAFHADSRYSFDEYMLIESANRCGLDIKRIADDDYYKEYHRLLGDESMNERLAALVTNDRPDVHAVETDNKFTNNVLNRLGFAWPFVSDEYLDKAIESIKTLGFFD